MLDVAYIGTPWRRNVWQRSTYKCGAASVIDISICIYALSVSLHNSPYLSSSFPLSLFVSSFFPSSITISTSWTTLVTRNMYFYGSVSEAVRDTCSFVQLFLNEGHTQKETNPTWSCFCTSRKGWASILRGTYSVQCSFERRSGLSENTIWEEKYSSITAHTCLFCHLELGPYLTQTFSFLAVVFSFFFQGDV